MLCCSDSEVKEKFLHLTFFPESVNSTTHSSPCSSFTEPASKPSFSEGTHTSFLEAQSAWARGLLTALRSPYRNLSASLMVALGQSKSTVSSLRASSVRNLNCCTRSSLIHVAGSLKSGGGFEFK